MDPIRESQNNQMDTIDLHDPDWVEKAWTREEIPGSYQHAALGWSGDDGMKSLKMDVHDKLCDPAGLAPGILPEEEGIDAAPLKRWNQEYTLSFPLWFWKLTTLSSRFFQGRHKSHKCDHCDIAAFVYFKDLNRHINDIHQTTKRYRCPVDGCKYGGAINGHSFKRKDNFRRHLREQHINFLRNLNLQLESLLESFLAVD